MKKAKKIALYLSPLVLIIIVVPMIVSSKSDPKAIGKITLKYDDGRIENVVFKAQDGGTKKDDRGEITFNSGEQNFKVDVSEVQIDNNEAILGGQVVESNHFMIPVGKTFYIKVIDNGEPGANKDVFYGGFDPSGLVNPIVIFDGNVQVLN